MGVLLKDEFLAIRDVLDSNDVISEDMKEQLISEFGIRVINNFISSLTEEEYEKYYNKLIDFLDNKNYYIDNYIELDLFKLYLNEMERPLLTKNQEDNLFIACKNAEEARNILWESNLRLVVSIAKKYKTKHLDLLDLIQEGNIGLLEAINRFDITKGYKFSTYATWWIEKYIKKSIEEKEPLIKLPGYLNQLNYKYYKYVRMINESEYRDPLIEEIALALDTSIDNVLVLKKHNTSISSLESKIKDTESGELSLSEVISDDSFEYDMEEKLIYDSRVSVINRILASKNLTVKEREMIKKRFGIDTDKDGESFQSIGNEYNMTREGVRQTVGKGLAKIRRCKIKYIREMDGLL